MLRERLSSRRALVALLQTQPNTALTELAAICGYDVLILDDEHGVFSAMEIVQAMQTLAGTRTMPFVRLRDCDARAASRYLDMGAAGLIVPGVNTAAEATEMLRTLSYPPQGTRGFGASVHRNTRYGLDVQPHLKSPLADVSLWLMVESRQAVEEIDGILAVEGIDGIIVGPSDLSANLGRLGDFSSSEYSNALTRIERAAAARLKLLGTVAHAEHSATALITRGYRLIIAGADVILVREALQSALDSVRPC